MANITNEILNKANGPAHDFKDKVQNAEKYMEKISHDVSEKVKTKADDLANSTLEYVKNGQAYVRQNPVKGVAVAVAAGMAIGSLMTLIMQRRQR